MKIRTFLLMFAVVGLAACTDDTDELLQQAWQEQEEGVSPFTRAAIDPTTLEDFRRTYGVGFSYDALYGEKCNMKDIHCQVIDYQAVKNSEKNYDEQLLRATKDNESTISTITSFSRSEYTQYVHAHADVDAKLIIVNGNAEGEVSFWEDGVVNKFFCESRYNAQAMSMRLEHRSIRQLIKEGKTELLTKNFREAVNWLAKHPGDEVVDSFIQRYGTHLVTQAKIGGSIVVTMRMSLDSVLSVSDVKMLGKLSVSDVLKLEGSSESYKKELSLMNEADCDVTVKGGDLSKIPNEMLHFTFGKHPNLNTFVTSWVSSLKYDFHSVQNSNMELIDMQVQPIWDYIPNADVANRIKKRVTGTASELIKEQGYQNGVSTEITLPSSVTCKMGGTSATFNSPAMVNVIAAGRYVASICRERVKAIDANNDVLVVYPIYDRQLNLSSGFCIHGGKAYTVRTSNDGHFVEEVGATSSTKVYMNLGVLSDVRYDNLTYQPSHNVIAYEWPYIIKQDGSVDSSQPYYLTYKNGLDFYLRDKNGSEQSGQLEAIPNWSYDSGKKRMVRNDDYRYYWNTKEVSY